LECCGVLGCAERRCCWSLKSFGMLGFAERRCCWRLESCGVLGCAERRCCWSLKSFGMLGFAERRCCWRLECCGVLGCVERRCYLRLNYFGMSGCTEQRCCCDNPKSLRIKLAHNVLQWQSFVSAVLNPWFCYLTRLSRQLQTRQSTVTWEFVEVFCSVTITWRHPWCVLHLPLSASKCVPNFGSTQNRFSLQENGDGCRAILCCESREGFGKAGLRSRSGLVVASPLSRK
jgi:hypothetical protein